MADNKAKEIWENTWAPETHTTDYALKRIQSALSAKLTPLNIDNKNYYGNFQGSHGRYETYLDNCPCGDFRRSKLPCKHIYRLAIELGLMNICAEHSVNAIVTPKEERISLDDTIDIIEKLSIDAQYLLLNIASNVRSTSPTYPVDLNNDVDELINSGIIVYADSPQYTINFGNKNEIMNFLDNENISYNKKAKKSVLEELCIKYAPRKAEKKFGITYYVSIPTKFSPVKIHYYLHRKYGYELIIDENENIIKVPLCKSILPDDDVTIQLIKHGYYSKK